MRFRTRSKGFTLIELMFVVMIIGIIAAIAVPNYIRFAKRAKEAVVHQNRHTMQQAIELFSINTLGVYPQQVDELALKALLPQASYPNNPFTDAETAVFWNADPAASGEMAIFNLPGGGYRLRAHGASAFLDDIVAGN